MRGGAESIKERSGDLVLFAPSGEGEIPTEEDEIGGRCGSPFGNVTIHRVQDNLVRPRVLWAQVNVGEMEPSDWAHRGCQRVVAAPEQPRAWENDTFCRVPEGGTSHLAWPASVWSICSRAKSLAKPCGVMRKSRAAPATFEWRGGASRTWRVPGPPVRRRVAAGGARGRSRGGAPAARRAGPLEGPSRVNDGLEAVDRAVADGRRGQVVARLYGAGRRARERRRRVVPADGGEAAAVRGVGPRGRSAASASRTSPRTM